MNYRHTFKTFNVERFPDEDHGEFVDRVDIITNARLSMLSNEYSIELDEYTNFIFSDDVEYDAIDGVDYYPTISAVVEIYEVPQEIKLKDFTLLTYRDIIKKKDNSGKITNINLSDAEDAINEQHNKLLEAMRHLRNLNQRSLDF